MNNPYLQRKINSLVGWRKPFRFIFSPDVSNLEHAEKITLDPKVITTDLFVGLVRDTGRYAYFPKYERFLKNNNISYDYFRLHHHNWLEEAIKFNVILWKPMSMPWALDEGREKIYILQQYLKKPIYPSFDEVMFYENKLLQYYILCHNGFPVIDTFISSDYDETKEWIQKTDYPFVSKIRTGSASRGTVLIKNKQQARLMVERIFRGGLPTYWPFLKQKNYVFFQKFIAHTGFDLRIIVIDENNILGYYRNVPRGDFRASGMGLVEFKELPLAAVKVALNLVQVLRFTNLAVDFLRSADDGQFHIIEASNIVKVDTLENLMVNDKAGRLIYDAVQDKLFFHPGNFWLQELILKRFFTMNDGQTISSEP